MRRPIRYDSHITHGARAVTLTDGDRLILLPTAYPEAHIKKARPKPRQQTTNKRQLNDRNRDAPNRPDPTTEHRPPSTTRPPTGKPRSDREAHKRSHQNEPRSRPLRLANEPRGTARTNSRTSDRTTSKHEQKRPKHRTKQRRPLTTWPLPHPLKCAPVIGVAGQSNQSASAVVEPRPPTNKDHAAHRAQPQTAYPPHSP